MSFQFRFDTFIEVRPLAVLTINGTSPEAIAWAHQYKNSKIVYLMPGFTKMAYANDSYQKFLANSIGYVADRQD